MTMSMIHNGFLEYELSEILKSKEIVSTKVEKLNKLYERVSELQKRNSRLVHPIFSPAVHPSYFTSLLQEIEAARNELLKNN